MTFAWPNHFPTLSAPLADPKLRVLSLGAGVQSSTLALAAARGDVGPMPDAAIFANTGWEPWRVMRHLAWLQSVLPFPVHEVSDGNLRQSILDGREKRAGRFASVPWFILQPNGKVGMGRRQCTGHYKIDPVARHIRQLLGVDLRARIPADSVEIWIGISVDEVIRMKPSKRRFIRNRWPLIEAQMSRRDCERWLAERQYSAPRSACIGCPFRKNAEWRDMRDNHPDEWAEAVEFDRLIRRGGSTRELRGEQFMHKSCLPLDQAPIDDDNEIELGFDVECEGMCGV